jgi:ABC-type protease/lipase transport system fused ATPase/permease subunit
LGGGGYYLKEYFFNPHSTCKVTGTDKRRKVFEKIKKLTHEQNFWIAFFGIILLAAAVNLVELVCSAGLPAVYTQILTLNSLPTWQYYGYLLLYIFVFMLDDLLVFILAMTTLKMTGISDKYSRISHLIGGIAMVIIGLLLLFKPEWLMFG